MGAALVLPSFAPLSGQSLPAALIRMAETERAFAQRARATTVREAFIEFFADESVNFEPDPVPAREALRKRTAPQPPGFQILWEPRLGDVSAAGDLGYLTGPAEYINPGRPTTYSCYFSVWKRQPDGEYRVILDIGASAPLKPVFAPGFVRAEAQPAWTGTDTREQADASLRSADERLGAAIAARGMGAALVDVMPASGRVHREGVMPMTRDAAVEWFAREVSEAVSGPPQKVETSASRDLGYTWGQHSARIDTQVRAGYFIRVWTRAADGTWRLVADVTTVPPPPRR